MSQTTFTKIVTLKTSDLENNELLQFVESKEDDIAILTKTLRIKEHSILGIEVTEGGYILFSEKFVIIP